MSRGPRIQVEREVVQYTTTGRTSILISKLQGWSTLIHYHRKIECLTVMLRAPIKLAQRVDQVERISRKQECYRYGFPEHCTKLCVLRLRIWTRVSKICPGCSNHFMMLASSIQGNKLIDEKVPAMSFSRRQTSTALQKLHRVHQHHALLGLLPLKKSFIESVMLILRLFQLLDGLPPAILEARLSRRLLMLAKLCLRMFSLF